MLACLNRVLIRNRHYFKNMDCVDLNPPVCVAEMKVLDREKFNKVVKVPKLMLPDQINVNRLIPHVKTLLLKMEHLKPVRSDEKRVLLHPIGVKKWEDLPIDEMTKVGIKEDDLVFEDLQLRYENWKYDEILKSVIPKDLEGVSSFSKIGHIVHLNLRNHLLPYKGLIAEVLKDKIAACKTVVNKSQTIDNTYRNFQMELLIGEPNYQVQVKENGVSFEFDFSTVYWNPRLCTEHERIVKMLRPNDILYDVFAGVGPFSVPAGKKKCQVLANDLNPDSFKWLQHNVKKNKIENSVKCFNKDGRDFILSDLKDDLVKRWNLIEDKYQIHITMNLPAMAVEFLDSFLGLLNSLTLLDSNKPKSYPLVHVYCFAKGDEDKAKIAQELVERNLKFPLKENLKEIAFVRNVAPNKDMMRVSFFLTDEILFCNNSSKRPNSPNQENMTKKQCFGELKVNDENGQEK